MSLWNCVKCGSRSIAASLTHCPVCREEKDVPKTTVAGSTNRWSEGESEATPEQVAAASEFSDPEAASAKAKEAKAAFEAGEHDKALELLDEASALHPERAEDFDKLKDRVVEAAASTETTPVTEA